MKATYCKYILDFKSPGTTSRGVLTQKETWFLLLDNGSDYGIGECALFRGLSVDDVPEYEEKLKWTCTNINLGETRLLADLRAFPSIQFGLEQAFKSLDSEDPFVLFASDFTDREAPIEINGLIWMGSEEYMQQQIDQKLSAGFTCLKMKIGAIEFEKEIALLHSIRKQYSKDDITIRVDANGAFSPEDAKEKLKILSAYDLHSIEQPIGQGNVLKMKQLCEETALPIALDEELIGIFDVTEKEELLQMIRPQYIILKPSLIGGYAGCKEWIQLASGFGIGWWITSALESNIGLNAIAQWTYTLENRLPQGLGTGGLFTNNIGCPLKVEEGRLYYKSKTNWDTRQIRELCL